MTNLVLGSIYFENTSNEIVLLRSLIYKNNAIFMMKCPFPSFVLHPYTHRRIQDFVGGGGQGPLPGSAPDY